MGGLFIGAVSLLSIIELIRAHGHYPGKHGFPIINFVCDYLRKYKLKKPRIPERLSAFLY